MLQKFYQQSRIFIHIYKLTWIFIKKTFKHIDYYKIDICHVTVLKEKDDWKFIFRYAFHFFF